MRSRSLILPIPGGGYGQLFPWSTPHQRRGLLDGQPGTESHRSGAVFTCWSCALQLRFEATQGSRSYEKLQLCRASNYSQIAASGGRSPDWSTRGVGARLSTSGRCLVLCALKTVYGLAGEDLRETRVGAPTLTLAATPRVRRTPLPQSGYLIVRGIEARPESVQVMAEMFIRRYPGWGVYGLSAFGCETHEAVDDICAARLARWQRVAVYDIGDLRMAGLVVRPTFRTPHVTITHRSLDRLISSLHTTRHKVIGNPYHGR